MRTISAIPYIILLPHHQTDTIIFIFFFIYHALYFPMCILTLSFTCFSYFSQFQPKAVAVNQMIHPCFRKTSTVGQLNKQAATAKKEK